MMLVLDTHVLIWMDEGNSRLGKAALNRINESLATGQLSVAAISFWETAMWVEKGRLTMETERGLWRTELLKAGLIEIPLLGTTVIRAGQLASFHGDPVDRMIVATAIENSAKLMTADERIISWNQFNHAIDARV